LKQCLICIFKKKGICIKLSFSHGLPPPDYKGSFFKERDVLGKIGEEKYERKY